MKINKTEYIRYEFNYKPDGVYLKAIMCDEDQAMSEGDLFELFKIKGIEEIDFDAVNRVNKMGDGCAEKIAPQQAELFKDDSFKLKISHDKLEATLTIYYGEENGKRLNKEQILQSIREDYGISFGIYEEAIEEMINNETYNTPCVVVRGRAVKDGQDGQVKYHFETNYNKVAEEVNGKIDFKKIHVFANVNKGDTLATKLDPVPGVDGCDIFGNIIVAKAPKDASFNYGKNVLLSSDGSRLISTIDGKADVVGNKVVVSQVYNINGNVDMSVGNIDFNGDVVITGNVMYGFEIKAGGSVDVYGVVEGAQIYAEENIRILGSFLGNGRGMLEAGGSVICKSVEQGTIKAGIDIEAEVVMHSNLLCNENIIINGEKSSVIGGNLKSGKSMILNNVGNAKGTLTSLTIETPDDIFQQLAKIDDECKKLTFILSDLNKRKDKLLLSNRIDTNEKVDIMNNILKVQKTLDKSMADKEKLENMIENVKNARIEIRGRGYNGVVIRMDNSVKKIDFTVDYTTYYVKDGSIKETPCK